MNVHIIIYFLGCVLNIEALLMILPCLTALIYGEDTLYSFLTAMALCGSAGMAQCSKSPGTLFFMPEKGLYWLP